MTHEARIAGKTVQVEVIAWRARSVLARRIDNGALIVSQCESVT